MVGNPRVFTALPVVDLQRALKFYREKLGFTDIREDPSPGAQIGIGRGTGLYLYQRSATKADHTAAVFEVQDLDVAMKELKGKGVHFEEYDLPGLKTVNGVATMTVPKGEAKTAWFKDTEGNILGLSSPMWG